jgi:hypothetical protein
MSSFAALTSRGNESFCRVWIVMERSYLGVSARASTTGSDQLCSPCLPSPPRFCLLAFPACQVNSTPRSLCTASDCRAAKTRSIGSSPKRLITQDNWQLYMYAAVDATGKKTGPYVDSHLEMASFFIIFMVIGSFFTVQLFVGVFIDTYQNVLIEAKMKGLKKLEIDSARKGLGRQDSIGSDSSSATGGSAVAFSEPRSKRRLQFYDIVMNKQ